LGGPASCLSAVCVYKSKLTPDSLAHEPAFKKSGCMAVCCPKQESFSFFLHGSRCYLRRSSHCPPENPQISKPPVPGSGVRKSSSSGSGKMLSMSYSESIRSGINRYHSDQGLNQPPSRPTDQVELQRLREQRIAAQIKNMEDFLKMNGLALEECVSFQTGMKYR
ncbi:hypothetical protein GOODEAATRI_005170, partial [Goodea atripinnis]